MNSMKVSTRLTLGFGMVLGLMAIIITLAIFRMSAMNNNTATIVVDAYPKVIMALKTTDNLHIVGRAVRNILLARQPETIAKEKELIAKTREANNATFAELDKLIKSEKGRELFAKIKERITPYRETMDRVIKTNDEGDKEQAVSIMFKELRPAQQAYFDAVNALVEHQSAGMEAAYKDASETYSNARTIMILLGAIAMALGVAAAFIITRTLTRQLGGEPDYAADIAGRIAHGDLAVAIDTRQGDTTSMLYAMKGMRDNLVKIVSEVRTGTDTIATASGQIAAGNLDLSARTEEQASSLEETAASMEELTSTVKQNADNARQGNQLAVTASQIAAQGGEVVSQVVTTMDEINSSSKKIVDIISVIDGIAFQTNILALNAAVEAARAGEQGRGFAVVATEVRSLAQRSASAAKEIKELIGNSVEKVENGTTLVEQAGNTMNEVVASVKRVTDIMGEITAASQEQSAGIEQVNQAITQMDQVTQQNAALVEEAAAAADSMQQQSARLMELVSVFKLDRNAVAASVSVPAAGVPAAPKLAPSRTPAKVSTKQAAAAIPAPAVQKKSVANGADEWEEF